MSCYVMVCVLFQFPAPKNWEAGHGQYVPPCRDGETSPGLFFWAIRSRVGRIGWADVAKYGENMGWKWAKLGFVEDDVLIFLANPPEMGSCFLDLVHIFVGSALRKQI